RPRASDLRPSPCVAPSAGRTRTQAELRGMHARSRDTVKRAPRALAPHVDAHGCTDLAIDRVRFEVRRMSRTNACRVALPSAFGGIVHLFRSSADAMDASG